MLGRRSLPVGAFFMVLVLALAGLGVGYGLWSKVLTIRGTVNTGNVNAAFVTVFTDDDGVPNDPLKDFYDVGECRLFTGPFGRSCDPRESDAEDQSDLDHRYDKGVATCTAVPTDPDDEQVGDQGAEITIINGYPSYHCNAWFDIQNIGSIPILLHSVTLQDRPATFCPTGTKYDLNGDGKDDVEICVSGFETLPRDIEPQIDPRDLFQMDLDIHVLQDAPQSAEMRFSSQVCLHQWNEEIGVCPAPLDG